MLRTIDVSSHQAGILPSTVDCDAVIVKTTGGNNYVNPAADPVLQDAFKHNISAGIYHYAHEYGTYHPSEEEARYFLDNSKGYLGKVLLALDYEEPINGKNYTAADVRWSVAWLKQVYEETGVIPLFYCSKSLLTLLDMKPIAELNVGGWVAQYANYNPTGWQSDPWTDNKGFGAIVPVIYQYTSTGRIAGWGGNLDLNIFYGDRSAWDRFATPIKQTDQPAPALPDYLNQFADAVLRGEYGNGDDRKDSVYNAVQKAVNAKLQN